MRTGKIWPNPYRDQRDRSTLWILASVLGFVLLAGVVAIWLLYVALR